MTATKPFQFGPNWFSRPLDFGSVPRLLPGGGLGLVLAAALALAGCGNERGEVGTAFLGAAQGLVARTRAAPQQDIRAFLNRATLSQVTQPMLLAEIKSRKAVAGMAISGRNRGHVTWRSGDNVALSFRDGMLSGTRGLGGDLMTADLDEPLAGLAGGGGPAVRIHRYLDGEDQLYTRSFVCSYQDLGTQTIEIVERLHTTRAVREVCNSTDLNFENRYWIGFDGVMWKSRQWISPEVGHVDTERLVL